MTPAGVVRWVGGWVLVRAATVLATVILPDPGDREWDQYNERTP